MHEEVVSRLQLQGKLPVHCVNVSKAVNVWLSLGNEPRLRI